MNYVLFDSEVRTSLLPFTFTRPVGEIRIGILTLREKWERHLRSETSYLAEEYLQIKYPLKSGTDNLIIDPSFLPSAELVSALGNLPPETALFREKALVAYRSAAPRSNDEIQKLRAISCEVEPIRITHTWDIFSLNGIALQQDFDLITKGRKSAPIPASNRVIRPDNIFLEEGARVEFSILNATEGPIYLGKDSEIMEGNMIRGAFALCEHAVVKMGAKIYGATTVGPYGKVCGEINNSVIFGYSSKGHDGYLGNSVLGEWCNIGADSNNSNLKNNYAKVRLWNYATERFDQTGLQFCGLMMGDHSKTAINTMFNTGTVIGVNCNIYTPGFPRNFVPSFSWGGATGFSTYQTSKAFEAAKVMMARRGRTFDEKEAAILEHVFEITKKWRKY
ncbi:UDP-N-acetylglucosamine diphosphorylase/glucosamine-1-phosphate N-acetyltransferase [Muriicola jejuensis]|uniref:Glucose-1-phosphate thymidylyltransferase n=1 Tax=Muriicola jejuensis TaxID=504488 RepID=A0A6P0UEB2_9FLAO|nr:GlmU family protein [Muriicola jejuensis]NER10962.1 glucose-1-phosphate thymidylyltransferase [Muriicola jejuensis]SMP15117.1 UDP-N-acetylglucosamine diphosphorylase/glucosamine-1-phosphate N-acetyltransferase [Muriicola jejuensis]